MRSLTNSKITNIKINRLDAFIKRCKRCSYCPHDFPNISEFFSAADDQATFSSYTFNIPVIWQTGVTTLY